jgi:hypothetical protein
MQNKEKSLSFDEPLRFVSSHSALVEAGTPERVHDLQPARRQV